MTNVQLHTQIFNLEEGAAAAKLALDDIARLAENHGGKESPILNQIARMARSGLKGDYHK